ncbi:MAG: pantoate--beta-alanine ligase [bacterium]|nr:pantoate--beta-alanine ligase [bacterium]
MKVFKAISPLREYLAARSSAGQQILFVPTMGALHTGHVSLVERAKADGGEVVLSIFVNPTQFNNPEDLEKYPRTVGEDLAAAKEAGVDCVFLPSVEEMYPCGDKATVSLKAGKMAELWCGASRPGHFDGVLTVVSALFNIVGPDKAYFGEKDWQQLQLIKRLVLEQHFPVEIVSCPTMREADGLAMSSRNVRLSADERLKALCLSRALEFVSQGIGQQLALPELLQKARVMIEAEGFEVDYLAVINDEVLPAETAAEAVRVLGAMNVGAVRLIDNMPAGFSLNVTDVNQNNM